jgi:hypothetical protein
MAFTAAATQPDHVMHRGALFPVLSAFRLLIDTSGENFAWSVPMVRNRDPLDA